MWNQQKLTCFVQATHNLWDYVLLAFLITSALAMVNTPHSEAFSSWGLSDATRFVLPRRWYPHLTSGVLETPLPFHTLVMELSKAMGEISAVIITSSKTSCEPGLTTRKLLRESIVVPQHRTQRIPFACLVPNKKLQVQVSFVHSWKKSIVLFLLFLKSQYTLLRKDVTYISIMAR